MNTYFYSKNGHYYYLISEVRCKNRVTGEWYDAVLYADSNGIYCREIDDFKSKFTQVK